LLVGNGNTDPDQIFTRALDVELEKIASFYQIKELETYGEVSEVLNDQAEFDIETQEEDEAAEAQDGPRAERRRPNSLFRAATVPSKPRRTSTISRSVDSDEDEDEMTGLTKSRTALLATRRSKNGPNDLGGSNYEDMASSRDYTKSLRRSSIAYDDYAEQAFSALFSSGITLKKRTIGLYVQLCELKSFIQLNQTGFKKVLKKYDKILDRNLKDKYLKQIVAPSYPFRASTIKHLEENIAQMESVYAHVVTMGDLALAKKELRLHLREHVVWERNTVWREMIGIERKAQAANMGIRRTLLGAETDPAHARLQGDDDVVNDTKELRTPLGRFKYPKWLFSATMFTLMGILAIFFALLFVPIMKKPEQQNCLAMLVFVSLLWATEVIPLFVTALIIPFLCVVLRVVRSDDKPHHRLEAKPASAYIFGAMWTPVIMLLLGGFTIAGALSKYDIAKRIATFVLSKAGTRPRTVLVTNMFVAAFASMWISNVAAPVLCLSIIQVSE
jgi:phosphate transporter